MTYHGGVLRVLDCQRVRAAVPARNDDVPPGHYKVAFVERADAPSRGGDRGRIFIAELSRRDVTSLTADEKATKTCDGLRIGDVTQPVGRLGAGADGESRASIETTATGRLPRLAVNASDLAALMNLIEPRLRCRLPVILSVA